MKKAVIFLLGCLISICSFAQDYEMKQIAKFENDKNKVYVRRYEEVAPQDDISKNYLIFTTKGDLCMYQADTSKMIYLNKKCALEKEVKMNLLIGPYDCKYTENHLLMSDKSGRIYLFDLDLKPKAYFETFDVFDTDNTGLWLSETYYNESSDILFFRDTKQNLYSLVHPSLNDDENRKNYKNPDETLNLFFNETIINNTSIRITKSGSLFINGNYTYFGQQKNGNYVYQINFDDCLVYDAKNPRTNFHVDCTSSNEQIESIAIHPCGDIYILRMNWQTNTHNLYYIENTWDPEWREQWYKEHPDAVRP